MKDKCLRCGQCCYYTLNGIKKKCRYLIGGKITSCRIYKNPKRTGIKIDDGIYCTPRSLDKRILIGCPHNEGK